MMRARNYNCLRLFALVAAVVAALLPARMAHAAAYTYSTHQRTINAGIILLDDANSGMNDAGANGASDPDPYVFYVLNQRNDIKPAGWNIVNPLAPASVSGPILTRWNTRSPGSYQLYQHITPNMAPYWEIPLSQQTDLNALLQFDVLLLNLKNHTVQLTSTEAEMLRRFVDGGGQLWVENSGGGQLAEPLFLNFQFNNAGVGAGVLPPVSGTLLRHPIIDAPYQLKPNEINNLGENHIRDTISADATLFSKVVGNSSAGNAAVIAAGQVGAGQIIVTTTGSSAAINDSVGGINPSGFGANSGGYSGSNFAAAPTADLKFVFDILSWDTAHPTEHKTSHQSSQSRSSLGPAVTPLWDYPIPGTNALVGATAPGAAINGDYVYARGVDGVLHAFNALPGTDILETGTPDAGLSDFIKGQPYDEIWNSTTTGVLGGVTPLGLPPSAGLSAPTVAAVPNGQTLAFVEGADGTVYAADAVTGAVYGTGANGKLPNSGGATSYSGPAPAPTFYGGRLYAGQPDGTLYIFDFNPGSASGGVKYQFNGSAEPVIAPPAVGIIRDTVMTTQVNDIVATLSTTMGVYTVMLGARHDILAGNGTSLTAQPAGPSASSPTLDSMAPFYIYTDNAGYPAAATSPYTPGPQYFGNYDVDFNAASPGNLNRAEFAANPATPGGYSSPPAATQAIISATALGPDGNLYYTVNLPETVNGVSTTDSTLVCAHDSRQANAAAPDRMNWRFRLPYTGESVIDADGINYNALQGFTFQGTPVVDGRGNVFALAVNPTNGVAAVVCMVADQAVTVQALPVGSIPSGDTVTISSITQPINGGGTDEFGGSPAQPLGGVVQYGTTPDGSGRVTLTNFGLGSPISPNVSEPEPVSLSYLLTSATGGSVLLPNPSAPLHTNMAWYAPLPDAQFAAGGGVPTSGLTLVGNYLFYGDGNGNVYRLYAYPGDAGLIGANRAVNVGTGASPTTDGSGQVLLAAIGTQAGAISGVLSAGGDVMIANGDKGVVGLGSRFTLVADNNRVLEVDSSGTATWAVDATTETTTTGALTHLELSRPSYIFQLAPNDYLVADTGNNRCVRFDRSGNVLWEMTRFNDYPDSTTGKSAALLTPGESTTLSHPTSAQSYQTFIPDPNNVGTMATITHYLISDTGNYRILEVVDVFDGKGNPVGAQHNLVWISHTYDVQGRRYRYASASYFPGPNSRHYVAALVTNARLAAVPTPGSPATGQLGPAAGDAPGSSLVLLDYDPANALGTAGFGSNSQATGFIPHAISTYTAFLQTSGQFDINNAPKLSSSGTRTEPTAAQTKIVKLFLRNPRFLQTYTPPGGTGSLQNFLLADDNGVFDLFLNSSSQFEAQWGYTQADYQAAIGFGVNRAKLKFLPCSLQRVGTEAVGGYLIGHYIVANGYSTGEVTPISGFGGESLELNDVGPSGSIVTQLYTAFSRVSGTSPLSQPAFAIREK